MKQEPEEEESSEASELATAVQSMKLSGNHQQEEARITELVGNHACW